MVIDATHLMVGLQPAGRDREHSVHDNIGLVAGTGDQELDSEVTMRDAVVNLENMHELSVGPGALVDVSVELDDESLAGALQEDDQILQRNQALLHQLVSLGARLGVVAMHDEVCRGVPTTKLGDNVLQQHCSDPAVVADAGVREFEVEERVQICLHLLVEAFAPQETLRSLDWVGKAEPRRGERAPLDGQPGEDQLPVRLPLELLEPDDVRNGDDDLHIVPNGSLIHLRIAADVCASERALTCGDLHRTSDLPSPGLRPDCSLENDPRGIF